MKALSLLAIAAIAGFASAQTCPANSGGLQVTTDKGCICPSGKVYSSGSCADNGACTANTTWPATTNTTFNSDNMALTTVAMTGYDSDVTLILSVPGMLHS
jgi:outer membrane protein W